MSDIIRDVSELSAAIRALRQQQGMTTTELAQRSGRSRDLIWRLEAGRDVSLTSMLDVVRALGSSISLGPVALPTLDEMRERFGDAD